MFSIIIWYISSSHSPYVLTNPIRLLIIQSQVQIPFPCLFESTESTWIIRRHLMTFPRNTLSNNSATLGADTLDPKIPGSKWQSYRYLRNWDLGIPNCITKSWKISIYHHDIGPPMSQCPFPATPSNKMIYTTLDSSKHLKSHLWMVQNQTTHQKHLIGTFHR